MSQTFICFAESFFGTVNLGTRKCAFIEAVWKPPLVSPFFFLFDPIPFRLRSLATEGFILLSNNAVERSDRVNIHPFDSRFVFISSILENNRILGREIQRNFREWYNFPGENIMETRIFLCRVKPVKCNNVSCSRWLAKSKINLSLSPVVSNGCEMVDDERKNEAYNLSLFLSLWWKSREKRNIPCASWLREMSTVLCRHLI